jgi:hypothetical protein
MTLTPMTPTEKARVWAKLAEAEKAIKKLTVPAKQMLTVAKDHAMRGELARIWEAENLTHGRIIEVMASGKGHVVLIMR